MKKIHVIFIVLISLSIIIFSGCSSGSNSPAGQRDFNRGNGQNWSSMGNITQEQRQQIVEQRQQELIEACQDKADGDSCAITTLRGETEGTCQNRENTLICTPQRQGMPNNPGGN